MAKITRERAERIAKAHACTQCGEYSYKKLSVKPATVEQQSDVAVSWHAVKVCGVCGHHQEMGFDEEGEVVYSS